MALLEKEATHFAASLDDYEHVSVFDIGGCGAGRGLGSWSLTTASSAITRSHRTATTADFIAALVDQPPVCRVEGGRLMGCRGSVLAPLHSNLVVLDCLDGQTSGAGRLLAYRVCAFGRGPQVLFGVPERDGDHLPAVSIDQEHHPLLPLELFHGADRALKGFDSGISIAAFGKLIKADACVHDFPPLERSRSANPMRLVLQRQGVGAGVGCRGRETVEAG